MKTKILYLLLFATAIFYYGCDSSGDTIHIDQETKDYCLFEQGSYWVYEDSATLDTDSVVITTTPYFFLGDGRTDTWETYSYNTYVCFENTNKSFNSLIRPGFDAEFETQKPIWVYMNVTDNYSNYRYYTYHNGSLGEQFWGGIDFPYFYLKYESFLEIYQLNNINHDKVKVFFLSDESTPNETIMKLYWAKHIGLIRIEDYTDSTQAVIKNLIRYNVENYEE